MRIKSRIAIYNIVMLITPILMIGVISVCFALVFIFKFPVDEFDFSRASMLDPQVFVQAVGEFFGRNPGAVSYFVIWALICLILIVLSTTCATYLISKSLEESINSLAYATDCIREGNLNFEVMGSDYYEIDRLCNNFDMLRKELKLSAEREGCIKNERNMLIANISHDLKTPITAIKGYVDGIRDGVADNPEKLNRYLNVISAKADTINDLVNNLSVLVKSEKSQLEFEFTDVDINLLVAKLAEEYRLILENTGISLKTEISSKSVYLKVDYEKIRRVISNLIDNSVKYRTNVAPYVCIVTRVDNKGVYITVSDNGIGMEEYELTRVFDTFYRADTSRSIDGSGLGLAIAKEFTEKHNGRLWLKSGKGSSIGTTATVFLPVGD